MAEDYNAKRDAWLVAKVCRYPNCKKRATDLHHSRGRLGPLLMDDRYWIPLCRVHHRWTHEHIAEARKLGLICDKGLWNTTSRNASTGQSLHATKFASLSHCEAVNLPGFPSRELIKEYHASQMPSCSIVKVWLCNRCNAYHVIASSPKPSGGSSGTGREEDLSRLLRLYEQTKGSRAGTKPKRKV